MTTLTDPTEDQINAAVAEHVAGWKPCPADPSAPWDTGDGIVFQFPAFTRSADAVLPLLEKAYPPSCVKDQSFIVEIQHLPKHERTHTGYEWSYCVQIFPKHAGVQCGTGRTFPLAACIALLRAKGIQVEFTKEARQ